MSDLPQEKVIEVDATSTPSEPRARADIGAPATPGGAEIASQSQKRGVPSGARAIMAIFEADPELAPLVLDAIKTGLRAETSRWDHGAKAWVTEVDAKTRLVAAQMVLNYTVGLPLVRSQAVNVNVSSSDTSKNYDELMVKSPAMRAAARRQLERAERLAKERELQKKGADSEEGAKE